MHESSMEQMKEFVEEFLNPGKKLKILDVGSYDVNGSYRQLFDKPNWQYFGLDIELGPNVDLVARRMYDWNLKIKFDVIISGQCLEHVNDTKRWISEVKKYLKPGGIVCIIAPWSWEEHRHPVDCWRILPDGMKFLLDEVGNFEIIRVYRKETDCVGIARKRGKSSIITKVFG